MTFRTWLLTIRNLVRRIPAALEGDRNIDWFRARLNSAIVMDHARAFVASAEIERCLRILRDGQRCRRLAMPCCHRTNRDDPSEA